MAVDGRQARWRTTEKSRRTFAASSGECARPARRVAAPGVSLLRWTVAPRRASASGAGEQGSE
jgi:hypothetical protein